MESVSTTVETESNVPVSNVENPEPKKLKSGRGRTPDVAGKERLVDKIRERKERKQLALIADIQAWIGHTDLVCSDL